MEGRELGAELGLLLGASLVEAVDEDGREPAFPGFSGDADLPGVEGREAGFLGTASLNCPGCSDLLGFINQTVHTPSLQPIQVQWQACIGPFINSTTSSPQ